MTMLKKMLKPIMNDFAPTERFSLRFQDGVEIYEHELAYKYLVDEQSETQEFYGPRLVIVETDSSEVGFIAKTRSEIAGLAAILKPLQS